MEAILRPLLPWIVAVPLISAAPERIPPYETKDFSVARSPLDRIVFQAQREAGIETAAPCSDEVFVRRVYLDVIGLPPTAAEAREFFRNRRRDKRSELIDQLLDRPEYADFWTMRWCDLLRVKSEFPINLWPNAVQSYQKWIHDCVRDNVPYDRMARQMITSSGSNFRVPQVNFLRAMQGRGPRPL